MVILCPLLASGIEEVDVGKNILEEAFLHLDFQGATASENHYSLKAKRDTRTLKIPRGFASKISGWNNLEMPFDHTNEGEDEFSNNIKEVNSVKTGIYEPTFWDEPHPQGSEQSKSKYPYNHVKKPKADMYSG